MQREFSAGGIVFKGNQVLLTKGGNSGKWQFPKGHVDEGEKLEDAAVREVREEGGVEAKIISKLGVQKYVYSADYTNFEKVFKVVTFFMMEYLSGDTKDHDQEVEEAEFFPIEEALLKINYGDQKKFLKQAMELRGY